MEKYHAILIQEIIFTFMTIPVMIGALIKGFQLIPLDYTSIAESMSIGNSPFLILIVFIIMEINALLAIGSIIILLINIGLIKETLRNPNTPRISHWASWTVKLCALSNILITWFLDKSNAVETDLKPALILWTITLGLSVLSSLLSNLMRK
jgi:hypothetical protein